MIALASILIIHSYPPGEWVHSVNRGLLHALHGRHQTVQTEIYHAEYWSRQPESAQRSERERLQQVIKTTQPDLIVISDDEAALVLAEEIVQSGRHLVLTGINSPTLAGKLSLLGKPFGMVLENHPTGKTIQELKRLGVPMKNPALISSRSFSSKLIVDRMRSEIPRLKRVHEFEHWTDWKIALKGVGADHDLLWVIVPYDVRDSGGQEVLPQRIAAYLERHVQIPTVGISSVHLKMGVLATTELTPFGLGQQAGEIAIQLARTGWKRSAIEQAKYYQFRVNRKTAKRLRLKVPPFIETVDPSKLEFGR